MHSLDASKLVAIKIDPTIETNQKTHTHETKLRFDVTSQTPVPGGSLFQKSRSGTNLFMEKKSKSKRVPCLTKSTNCHTEV